LEKLANKTLRRLVRQVSLLVESFGCVTNHHLR
jgi:hypothetical protein